MFVRRSQSSVPDALKWGFFHFLHFVHVVTFRSRYAAEDACSAFAAIRHRLVAVGQGFLRRLMAAFDPLGTLNRIGTAAATKF